MIIHSQHSDALMDSRHLPTRRHDGLIVPIPNRCNSRYMRSFVYIGWTSWNCLPPDVQLLPNIESFKLHIRRMLYLDEKLTYEGTQI